MIALVSIAPNAHHTKTSDRDGTADCTLLHVGRTSVARLACSHHARRRAAATPLTKLGLASAYVTAGVEGLGVTDRRCVDYPHVRRPGPGASSRTRLA